MFNLQPTLFKDFYKTGHAPQYPENTQEVYSNMTARSSRIAFFNETVSLGMQGFVKEFLIEKYNRDFFNQPKEKVVGAYKRRMDYALGPDMVDIKYIAALHDLGYLPLEIRSIAEGTIVPVKVPVMTIRNTHPDFFWLTNDLETLISCELWGMQTSARIAMEFRCILSRFAKETSDMPEFVLWQAHDFSMRGHRGVDAAIKSGFAHLCFFQGTDTVPSIDYAEHYYGANCEKEMVGGSVPATEHSVMCMGGKETEIDTYRRLMTEVCPSGILSIVSDTWDYWKVLTETLPQLKQEILARNGKVVIRPDSGDPHKIINGDPEAPEGSPQRKGTLQILWEIFGGSENSKGFRQLDPHIGVIYGDNITMERCHIMCVGMKTNKFATTNMVFGVGSFQYQYNTRDTLGYAIKATHGVINGQHVDIFKDPKTDSGVKKSAKGYLRVNADMSLSQQVTEEEMQGGLLELIFKDGKLLKETTLAEIRDRISTQLA